MQVDPIKPTLKAPGTKRLKLKNDVPLSNFAFKFNLRRYNKRDNARLPQHNHAWGNGSTPQSTMHGRAVQADPIKPTLKAPGTKRLKLKYGKLFSNFAF